MCFWSLKPALSLWGGYQVSTLTDPHEAVGCATQLQPDIILLDVMMPEMDGPATLKALRAAPATQKIPVIFITARIRESEISEYTSMGADGVLAKPFDPMHLSAQVEALWKHHLGQ